MKSQNGHKYSNLNSKTKSATNTRAQTTRNFRYRKVLKGKEEKTKIILHIDKLAKRFHFLFKISTHGYTLISTEGRFEQKQKSYITEICKHNLHCVTRKSTKVYVQLVEKGHLKSWWNKTSKNFLNSACVPFFPPNNNFQRPALSSFKMKHVCHSCRLNYGSCDINLQCSFYLPSAQKMQKRWTSAPFAVHAKYRLYWSRLKLYGLVAYNTYPSSDKCSDNQ